MLKVYFGNRLEELLKTMDGNICGSISGPLAKTPVCIQTPGMQRWIGLRLAEYTGVSANLDFVFPGALMKRLTGIKAGERTPWPEKQELIWRVFDRLLRLPDKPEFENVRSYLEDDATCIKSFRLARRIADTFDQYQVYRPEMVLDWLSPRPKSMPEDRRDHWQPELFRSLFSHPSHCKTYHFDKFLRSKASHGDEAVHVFGVSVLPPLFIEMLRRASEERDVCLYLLNPSAEYWGDSKTVRQKRWLEKRTGKAAWELYIQENHDLLDNLGAAGRDFFDNIQGADDLFTEEEQYSEIERKNVLTGIQTDILHLENGGETYETDSSVVINSCHNPLREAEVLYDQLLELFDRDKSLTPSDILVMTPDIEKYAPYIRAVFDNPYSENERIPYSVADVGEKHINRPAGIFLELVEALRGDFTLADVFRLLSSPIIADTFKISRTGMDTLASVLELTGAFWGHGSEHLQKRGLDTDCLFTWERALRRVALGLAEGNTGAVYNDAAGTDIPFSLAAEIGGLMKFADLSSKYAAELEGTKTPGEWCSTLSDIASDFFTAPYAQADDMLYLEKCIADAARETENLSAEIPFEPVYERIKETLSETRGAKGFISGRVTFCAMLPMRSIPFRVICIMGLNENTFPRQKVTLEFDLMAKHPKPGDRDNRDSDRYLFLETLVSAREKLILSYTGQSERDNSELPPSVLITELAEHIKSRFNTENLITNHRLHSFSRHYFDGERLFTYSAERYKAAEKFASAKGNADFAGKAVPAEVPVEVTLEDFESFFVSPAGHFLRRVLGIDTEIRDESLPETEVMTMDTLRSYSVEDSTLRRSLEGNDPESMLAYLFETAQLPPENLGRYHITDIEKKNNRAFHLAGERLGGLPAEAEIDTVAAGLRIKGKIPGVRAGRHVYIKPSSLKPKDVIRGWIRHLLLNASTPTDTFLIGTGSEINITPADTKPLEALAEIYKKGQNSPLRFHVSDAFRAAGWKAKPVKDDSYSTADSDRAYRICFKGEPADPELCRQIVEPIRKHLEGKE